MDQVRISYNLGDLTESGKWGQCLEYRAFHKEIYKQSQAIIKLLAHDVVKAMIENGIEMDNLILERTKVEGKKDTYRLATVANYKLKDCDVLKIHELVKKIDAYNARKKYIEEKMNTMQSESNHYKGLVAYVENTSIWTRIKWLFIKPNLNKG